MFSQDRVIKQMMSVPNDGSVRDGVLNDGSVRDGVLNDGSVSDGSVRDGVLNDFVLTVSCPDRPGLVYAVSGFLVDQGANIVQSQQFGDPNNQRFFMRVHFEVGPQGDVAALPRLAEPSQVRTRPQLAALPELATLRNAFAAVAQPLQMDWEIHDARTPPRTLIMVSNFGHCLNDLLFRVQSGALNIEVCAIVSNHRTFADLASSYGVEFHYIPVTAEGRAESEARLLGLVDAHDVDLVVLARYMQILSDPTCRRLRGRAINIHHSFLPSFKGAKPYHQAHDRGVKLIGATAHYVTDALDEGPIIEQDVTRTDHTFTPRDLVTAGRDVEAQVLARAVRWHCERRVLLNGDRTVVFR